ncbi:MAG: tetratricopeptide repeat protein [Planctomycetia bacterium]|nr:tetratricopeptide repeat protein [Planctomycetia bacterium]
MQRERGEVYRLLAVDPAARPRDLKPGLEAYGKALELDPRDAYSLVGRAKLHAWLGAPKKAIDDLLPAIKLNRDAVKDAPSARVTQRLNTECADIYFHLGKAQAALGNHDKAIGEFDRALETCSRFDDKPLRTQIREERGLSHLQLKQPDKAVEDFDDALDLNRNNARAHAFKGYALHLLKRNDQAKPLLADAIILSNQQWGWPYLARSLANRAIGLLKEEEADRLKAKQLGCTVLFPVR